VRERERERERETDRQMSWLLVSGSRRSLEGGMSFLFPPFFATRCSRTLDWLESDFFYVLYIRLTKFVNNLRTLEFLLNTPPVFLVSLGKAFTLAKAVDLGNGVFYTYMY